MITSSSPAVVRYYLALRLTQLRTDCGLTKQQAAQKIGRTGQTVANLEKGFNAPTQSDLEKLLEVYGAAEQFPELRELLPVARKRVPKRSAPIPEDYDLRLNLEVDMARLDILGASLIPGLLQTPDYAAAVFRANPNCSDEEIQQLVDARMERKSIYTRAERPVELHVVLDESVLYRSRGGDEVMRGQLDSLLAVARTPSVDLQVLPLDAGSYLGEGSSWTIMTFPEPLRGHPGLVHLDLLGEARYVDDREMVELYRRAWRHVLGAAASPERSLQRIREARSKYGDQG
ncbi:helix-turn-helix protein [Halopolyspora algeriensis]|uniref:Helix-turn-helix protein n=1 Tax=Halopolyspora algeriensis TaxID=1500506 RepID=A0A368VEQ9_9ACTN|nr:helix-turn-helix transcriptional regulator [Halopolyspora algeriensis]RCW39183.1 helix-turn-helix protein [Halopolyspora algeriensis]TQM47449.1 helix-turn-helix protein [Halopolyspora algeriensis]